jgi:hypothetical protein
MGVDDGFRCLEIAIGLWVVTPCTCTNGILLDGITEARQGPCDGGESDIDGGWYGIETGEHVVRGKWERLGIPGYGRPDDRIARHATKASQRDQKVGGQQ